MSTLSFHTRTGSRAVLSNSNRSAQRSQPYQEFNNALVISSMPLIEGQLFEVCIDKKVPSWSGSIEIGVTSTDPAVLDFPLSATDLREGSWVMSGMSVLQDGRTLIDEYGDDLDQLSEGDRVGVMRSASGDLHFFINGINQGVVASIELTNAIYAVVDLYGKCAQVTIVEPRNDEGIAGPLPLTDTLHFHDRCGSMIKLSNENLTVERKRYASLVHNGVAMTHRPLQDNELFEIKIDEFVGVWSKSFDVGVTTVAPDTEEFPIRMWNVLSGTVMLYKPGISTDGKGAGHQHDNFSSEELKVGDRIGFMRTPEGNLHYYCNGIDRGLIASEVPSPVYGVVDIYGAKTKLTMLSSTAQASSSSARKPTSLAIDLSPCHSFSASYNGYNDDELLFHPRCGDHVAVVNSGRTAIRPNCQDDFNNAVVLTERSLHPGEFFQVVLEHIVAKWAGSIEIGVTTHCARDFAFPPTMTNVRSGTWMMTGNGILYNGTTIIDEYGRNLDKLKAGDRVGLKVTAERKLHFYVNGCDQGLAASGIPENVYGVIDLYGQAAKASIVYSPGTTPLNEDLQNVPSTSYHRIYRRNRNSGAVPRPLCLGKREVNHINESSKSVLSNDDDFDIYKYFPDGEDNDMRAAKNPLPPREPIPSFHSVCGLHVVLSQEGCVATRVTDFDHGLVFSEKPFELEGFFEVQLYTTGLYGGVLRMGLTTYVPKNSFHLPSVVLQLRNCESWILAEGQIFWNGEELRRNYCPNYFYLRAGAKVGVKKDDDGNMSFTLDGKDLGIAARHVPRNVYVVCDIYGSSECIKIIKTDFPPMPEICDKNFESECGNEPLAFHENHGENIKLSQENKVARRISSYAHGVVLTNRSLKPGELFEVRIDDVNSKWSYGMRIGVTKLKPEEMSKVPMTFFNMRKYTWAFCQDSVYHNGEDMLSDYGPDLDDIFPYQKIGVLVNASGELHLYVDGVDCGTAIDGIIFPCYGFVDVYGECVQVSFPDVTINECDLESVKDNEEKSDTEGVKETICKCALTPRRSCKFSNRCNKVRLYLGLYDVFFNLDSVDCFCDICQKRRINIFNQTKGDPAELPEQPVGWCRFEIKVYSKADKKVLEGWNNAYHGVRSGDVRRMLDHGKLLPPDQLGLKLFDPNATENEREIRSRVLISPSLEYATLPQFSPTLELRDREVPGAKIRYNLAFQVFIRPGSYTVNNVTSDVASPTDNNSNNTNIEWHTKEQGSTVLYALLIRMESYEMPPTS